VYRIIPFRLWDCCGGAPAPRTCGDSVGLPRALRLPPDAPARGLRAPGWRDDPTLLSSRQRNRQGYRTPTRRAGGQRFHGRCSRTDRAVLSSPS
jgi:hypothetical protein